VAGALALNQRPVAGACSPITTARSLTACGGLSTPRGMALAAVPPPRIASVTRRAHTNDVIFAPKQ